jgi:hypothetical protein
LGSRQPDNLIFEDVLVAPVRQLILPDRLILKVLLVADDKIDIAAAGTFSSEKSL